MEHVRAHVSRRCMMRGSNQFQTALHAHAVVDIHTHKAVTKTITTTTNQPTNNQPTNQQPTNNQPTTTNKRELLVMVLSIFSLLVLLRLVFGGILMLWLGRDLVCLCLATWLALFSILRPLFLMLGEIRLQLTFVDGRVFVVSLCWIFMALCSPLILLMSGKEMRSVMVGCVWNGILHGRVRGQPVPCRFCGAPDGDDHLFGECTFPPLVEIRGSPEFYDLMREDKGSLAQVSAWARLASSTVWC